MKTVSIEEARAGLGDLVDRARMAGEPTMITRYGRPAAVVVGEEWFREAEDALLTRPAPAGAADVQPEGQNDR